MKTIVEPDDSSSDPRWAPKNLFGFALLSVTLLPSQLFELRRFGIHNRVFESIQFFER